MSNREYFRVETTARVALRLVPLGQEDAARARVRLQHVPEGRDALGVDERTRPDERAMLETLQRIALLLERMDRRFDELLRFWIDGDREALLRTQPVPISLSASGFSGPFKLDAPTGSLVEVYLDLQDGGVPIIPALAQLVRADDGDECALAFEEILPADRERIVQFTIRRQSQALREGRRGDNQ